MTSATARRLERIPAQGKIAGVCAGIANYLDTDVVLVRALWVLLSIVPGTIIGGVLAYAAAWMLMPESATPVASPIAKRLVRPQFDRKVAGVCAGLARYFSVDVTLVRLIWVVLSIYPGVLILGVLAYAIAWFVIPAEPDIPMQPASQTV
jgi:phage shock protein PspC (stress-responsive transcriptional regulator)